MEAVEPTAPQVVLYTRIRHSYQETLTHSRQRNARGAGDPRAAAARTARDGTVLGGSVALSLAIANPWTPSRTQAQPHTRRAKGERALETDRVTRRTHGHVVTRFGLSRGGEAVGLASAGFDLIGAMLTRLAIIPSAPPAPRAPPAGAFSPAGTCELTMSGGRKAILLLRGTKEAPGRPRQRGLLSAMTRGLGATCLRRISKRWSSLERISLNIGGIGAPRRSDVRRSIYTLKASSCVFRLRRPFFTLARFLASAVTNSSQALALENSGSSLRF